MTTEGEVLSLAFGGDGIVKHNGQVIFIPFTAPGDIITFHITTQKKGFAFGKLDKILKPSPLRTDPLCPYYGTCGGCQLQHIRYEAQAQIKQQQIVDALQRIGKIDCTVDPIIQAPSPWAYRRHITLTLENGQANFIKTDQTSLLPIQKCPIFIPLENTFLKNLQEWLAPFKISGKLAAIKQGDKFLLHFFLEKSSKEFENCTLPSFCSGLYSQKVKKGQVLGELFVEDLRFEFAPGAFIQNNAEQSLKIYQMIVDICKTVQPQSILDLYCGIGISSLMLAKNNFKVHGIEISDQAIASAKENAKKNQIKNSTFQQGKVEKIVEEVLKIRKPDLVIVNPPRTGLHPQVTTALTQRPAQDLIYISCMPATLARDLKQLSAVYSVVRCQPFDMFPQTGHVETLIHLKKA